MGLFDFIKKKLFGKTKKVEESKKRSSKILLVSTDQRGKKVSEKEPKAPEKKQTKVERQDSTLDRLVHHWKIPILSFAHQVDPLKPDIDPKLF